MTIGIIGAWYYINKWVYVCPAGAACPNSINPDNGFLQSIRTVMQYWLHVGMLIFGVGLVKLVAYQAWSAMQQRGNTIDILGLNIGVVNGSAFAAAKLLLLRRRNRSLCVFMLTHVAIITAIPLIVGRSLTRVTDMWSVEVPFDYPMNISILNQESGAVKYGETWAWLINGATNLTSNKAFSGTFIIQDSRVDYTHAQPSGKRISGSVSCVDPSANIFVDTTRTGFNSTTGITYLPDYTHNVSGNVILELDTNHLAIGKLIGQYLPAVMNSDHEVNQNATFIWFTNTDGIIPNAMEVSNVSVTFNNSDWIPNNLFIGLCEHTVTFPNVSQNDSSSDGMQYINPSRPAVYYLPAGEDSEEFQAICEDGCMSTAVWNTLLTWWGREDNILQGDLQQTFGMDIYCYGGMLAPVDEDTNQTCPSLDGEIWNRTLALVLDAMIQTYPTVGIASQTLSIQVESLGLWQWQGVIPFSAFILYVACLAYTVTVYWAGGTMKELDLLEVVNATHAEEESLTKSVMVGGILKE